jgi:hypothetical protein
MKLFHVNSTAKEFSDCKDVHFHWFRSHAQLPTREPYAELIKDYDPNADLIGYAEDYIESLFSAEEAEQLKEYLDRKHGHEGPTTITEAELPCQANIISFGAMAVGGKDDFYRLCNEAEYSLPFKVWGYFNLLGCELIDGSGTFKPVIWVVDSTHSHGAAATHSNE